MVYTVLGYRNSSFMANDGSDIKGTTLYLGDEIKSNGEGISAFRVFVLPKKFVNGIMPVVGGHVQVHFNRYGKVDSVEVE